MRIDPRTERRANPAGAVTPPAGCLSSIPGERVDMPNRYEARELALKDVSISRNARLLYFAIDNYQRDNREGWCGQDTLARDLGCSQRSVKRWLAELRSAGLCVAERRGYGESNSYVLHWGQICPHYGDTPVPSVGPNLSPHKANQALKPEIQGASAERQNPANIAECRSCRGSGRVMIPAIGWSSCSPCRGTGMAQHRRTA